MNPRGTRKPFFFVHGVGEHVIVYRELTKSLGSDQPVYVLQAEESDFGEVEPTIELMAGEYIRRMRVAEPRGPYLLGGHSFGGFVAFEMVQQLSLQGEDVALLALIDTRATGLPRYASALHAPKRVRYYAGILAVASRYHLNIVRGLPWREKVGYVIDRLGKKVRETREAGSMDLAPDHPVPSFFRETVDVNLMAVARYLPKPYAGKVTLFRAEERHPVVHDMQLLGWGDLASGGIEVHEIPGDHVSIVRPPNLNILAEKLRRSISSATGAEGEC